MKHYHHPTKTKKFLDIIIVNLLETKKISMTNKRNTALSMESKVEFVTNKRKPTEARSIREPT